MTRSVMICRHCVDTTPNHLPPSQHPLVIIFQLVTMTPLSIPLPNMFPLLNMSPLATQNIGLSSVTKTWHWISVVELIYSISHLTAL